jgi:uncharacterized membrane protein YfcA
MEPGPGTIAWLCAAALAAGFVDAIAGGGGLLTLPALLAAGIPPYLALGTNKGGSVFGSGAALARYARSGLVDGRRAKIAFPLGFLGSLAGAWAVLLLDPGVLRPVILVLLPTAAAVVLLRPRKSEDAPAVATGRGLPTVAAVAAVVGAYDGFFGPGTGTFLILAWVGLLGMAATRASAEAKVVNFASNLAAAALFAWRGTVLWEVALPMAAAQIAGGVLGAHLAIRRGDRLVRGAVAVVVLALVVKLAADALSR